MKACTESVYPYPRPTFGRHPFSPHAEKGERVKSLSVYGEGNREG